MAESESEHMTVAEAREFLGVSKRAITRLIAEGILPAAPNLFDKRSKLVRRADVEALKRQGRRAEQTPRKNAA
jgi:excisionase family DNA binding protein